MSSDVDLFAEASGEFDFPEAAGTVISAYQRAGLEVQAEVQTASFARLNVRSASESAKVELGLDWRKNKPIGLAVGPVLHADDAVANKVCALVSLTELRARGCRFLGQWSHSVASFPARDVWGAREGSGGAGGAAGREVA